MASWCQGVKIGSGNGLLLDGTKPLREPMLTSPNVFCGIHLTAISQVLMCSEITHFAITTTSPGANELILSGLNNQLLFEVCSEMIQINSLPPRSNHNQVVKVACSIVMSQLTLKHLLQWHFIVFHSSVLHGWALISNLKDIASKLNAWHQLMWLKLVLILRYAGAQHKYIFIYNFLSL